MKIHFRNRNKAITYVMDRYEWELLVGYKQGCDPMDLMPLINAIFKGHDITKHYYADELISYLKEEK